MKRNNYIGYLMMAAAVLTATSCTDFDDYNEVPSTASDTPTAGKTLWQTISQRQDLGNFIALMKRTGYHETLDQLNAYTVWAPLDGKFDASRYEAMSDSMLREQFVKNHIAKFNFTATGEVNERIRMLNGKYHQFEGNGDYRYAGVSLGESNVPCSNGTLHLINGEVPFYPNLYEYLSVAKGVDMLVEYFKKYEKTELNLQESEKGPMVNGMQTYVDSVLVTSNELLTRNRLNADLVNEDSSYTFLMPTDNAYEKMYNSVRNCYKYLSNTTIQDIDKLEQPYSASRQGDSERNVFKKTSDEINPVYQADSIARLNLVSHLIYNNRDTMNMSIVSRPIQEGDTLQSTRGGLFSNPQEMLNDYLVGEPVQMSNGWARIVDSLAFKPWELYNPELVYMPTTHMGKSFLSRPIRVPVADSTAQELFGPEATDFTAIVYTPTDEFCVPNLFMKLPNVRSATYNFYCVVLPASLGAEQTTKPTPLNFDLSYCGAGGLTNYHFSSSSAENPNVLDISTSFISTDVNKVDTIYMGQFTFPFCYEGLGRDFYPSINITCPLMYSDPLFEPLYNQYSTEMRIYAIILRPVEKDEYEAKNQ